MNVKYGCYIKGRGWIKSPDYRKSNVKCCRNAGDIHNTFILSDKSELPKLLVRYKQLFGELKYELREIPCDSLIDKRVVSSRKREDWVAYNYRKFPSTEKQTKKDILSGLYAYCTVCNLYIDPSEMESESICVHCLNAIHSIIESEYEKMDDEIKKSWERAKMFDEI